MPYKTPTIIPLMTAATAGFIVFCCTAMMATAADSGCTMATKGGCMLMEKCNYIDLSKVAVHKAEVVNRTCSVWVEKKSQTYFTMGCGEEEGGGPWKAYGTLPVNISRDAVDFRVKAYIDVEGTGAVGHEEDVDVDLIVSSTDNDRAFSDCGDNAATISSISGLWAYDDCVLSNATSQGVLGACTLPKHKESYVCNLELHSSRGYARFYLTFVGGWGPDKMSFGSFNVTFSGVQVCETVAPEPPSCSQYHSCTECLSEYGCGWCKGRNLCVEGEMMGPYNGVCSSPDWAWNSVSNCPSTLTPTPTIAPIAPEGAAVGIVDKIANAIASIFRSFFFLAPFLQG